MLREEEATAKSWDLLSMSPQDRREAIRKIAAFVDTLHLLEVEIATCWFLHPRQCTMLARLMEWDVEATTDPKGTARAAFEWFSFGISHYIGLGFSSHGHHKERGAKAHELSRKTPTPTFEEFIDGPAFDEVWATPTADEDQPGTEDNGLAAA